MWVKQVLLRRDILFHVKQTDRGLFDVDSGENLDNVGPRLS